MRLNWKRILLVIGFIATVVIIGYLLYYLFLRPAVPETAPTNVNVNAGPGVLPPTNVNVNIPVSINGGLLPSGEEAGQPPGPPEPISPTTPKASPIATGGLTQIQSLTNVAAYGATLSADGSNILYYDKNSGLFYRVDASGKSTPLSDQIFFSAENIFWSPNKEKAVIEYPDSANIIYDFKTKKQITLPSHWQDFSFSPNSDELVFKSIGQDQDNSWLAVARTDGSSAQKIEHLGDRDRSVHPDWSPNEQIIASYTEGKNFDQQYLYFVGLNNENFKSVVIKGWNYQGKWSTNGDRLLYSVYSSESDYKPQLFIVSAQGESIGQNLHDLGLQTWADKCSFANNDTVYCAVPQSLEEGAGIFEDELDNSPTDIYKIDLKTGFKTKVATPENNHNIASLTVPANGQYLYFVSKDDGRLYRINLR